MDRSPYSSVVHRAPIAPAKTTTPPFELTILGNPVVNATRGRFAVAGVNVPSKRLPPHRNDEVLTVGSVELDIQNSIDRKQKKTSKNILDRPKLILTMPSISDDGY